jgi:hypothetical protein
MRLFNLDSSPNFWEIFHGKGYVLICTKNGLGLIRSFWAIFKSNSSGHPGFCTLIISEAQKL